LLFFFKSTAKGGVAGSAGLRGIAFALRCLAAGFALF